MTEVSTSSAVEQVNLSYDVLQDRLVLRLRIRDAGLVDLWLSRRFTKVMLPALQKLLGNPVWATDDSTRRELLAYEHKETVEASDYGQPFNGEGRKMFGESPLLITEVKLYPPVGQHAGRLEFKSPDGRSLGLAASRGMVHNLIKMFNGILPKTGWDIETLQIQGAIDSAGRVMH